MKRVGWLVWVAVFAMATFSFAQTVAMITPNGGERYTVGQTVAVTYEMSGFDTVGFIQINRAYPTGTWQTIGTASPNARTMNWVATSPVTETARMRIAAHGPHGLVTDESNGNFTIASGNTTPTIVVTRPNGGETFAIGSTQQITWTATGITTPLHIFINRNYPTGAWVQLGTTEAAARSFNWVVTGEATQHARIRVATEVGTLLIQDESNHDFIIASNTQHPTLQVMRPNGGENWAVGSEQVVTWLPAMNASRYTIQLNRAFDSNEWITLGSVGARDTLFTWTVTGPAAHLCRVKVVATIGNASTLQDISDANFTISGVDVPTIRVTRPNGGERYAIGARVEITWQAVAIQHEFQVQLCRSYPDGAWFTLGTTANTQRYFVWTVDGPVTEAARIRVRPINALGELGDMSDHNFAITGTTEPRAVTVLRPNGREVFHVGTLMPISWEARGLGGPATVLLNRNFPDSSGWVVIGRSEANTNRFNWRITGDGSERCRVMVSYTTDNGAVFHDISNGNFRIVRRLDPDALAPVPPEGREVTQPDLVASPNPFNATTTIRYSLAEAGDVQLTLFDRMGREVAVLSRGAQAAGDHAVTLSGDQLSTGVYFLQYRANGRTQMQKLVLMK